MGKKEETSYFKKIGDLGVAFTLNKPYSDKISVGCLMHNIASISSILKNNFGVENVKIIDIGCGSGWTSNQLAYLKHDVLGVDISPEAINAAKANFKQKNLKYLRADYDSLSKSFAKQFDVIVFHDSLHHSDSIKDTLKLTRSLLKDGGICIVCEPGSGHSKSPDALEAVAKYGVTEKDLPPSDVVRFAKYAGYKKYKIYASPSLMHRTLYWEYEQKTAKGLVSLDVFRFIALATFFLLKKKKEGLVVLYN